MNEEILLRIKKFVAERSVRESLETLKREEGLLTTSLFRFLGKLEINSRTHFFRKDGTLLEKSDSTFSLMRGEYEEGKSSREVARSFGLSKGTVEKFLRSKGLKLRSLSSRQTIRQASLSESLKNRGFNAITTLHLPEVEQKIRETNRLKRESYKIAWLKSFGYELLDNFTTVSIYPRSPGSKTWKRYKVKHVCGMEFEDDIFNVPRCPECFPLHLQSSNLETFYKSFIESLGFEVLQSVRDLVLSEKSRKFYELDLYVPSLKVAFEINGLYWHAVGTEKSVKDAMYHFRKSKDSLRCGIRLYHIWEHQNVDIVKSMISNALGKFSTRYGARELIVKELSTEEKSRFFDSNHLFGDTQSTLNLGLFRDKDLVSAVSFRPVKGDKLTVELARFASLKGVSVAGGFSKLLKHAAPYLKRFTNLLSYADTDWSPDPMKTVYSKVGFTFVGNTGPSMYYTDFHKVYSRQAFQKHKLLKLFPESYNNIMTEREILAANRIYPIFTSGNWKFVKSLMEENYASQSQR